MKTQAYVRQLAAGLICMSITAGAGAAVIDPALAALLGIPEVELTGAYAEATAEAISTEFISNTDSGSGATTIDVTTSSAVTGASGNATAGADFPDANGMGSATRASASVAGDSSDFTIADSVGTGFIAGGFEASGGGAGPHSVTFNFDITALVTLADGGTSDDILTAGVSAFALVFDAGFEDVFLAGFSLDGGGAAGTMATRSGSWNDVLLDADFVEDPLLDPMSNCGDATIDHQCSWAIDTTASVTYEYVGDFAEFSLVYGIQTSVLGVGTTYELISDASGTSILASIQASDDVEVIAQSSQIVPEQPVPEPTSAALLGIGLLLGTAAAIRRRRGEAAEHRTRIAATSV